jgi:CelD/BcsL family acetyltransferase involved in cellulose biosynthesis
VGRNELHLEVMEDFSRLNVLQQQWDDLVHSCDDVTLYHSSAFLTSWWEAFGRPHKLRLFVVTTPTREWVAVLPMLLESSRYRGLPVRILRFLENGYVPSCRVLVHRDFLDPALTLLCRQLFSFTDWDMVRLGKLPAECKERPCILRAAKAAKLSMGSLPSIETPIIHISGSWEDFLRQRSTSFRKQLRSKCNQFNRDQGMSIRAIKLTPKDVAAALEAMCAISAASWKHDAGTDLAACREAQTFVEGLCLRLAEQGNVMVWFAYKDDTPVAYELHLRQGQVTYPLRADFDERYRSVSPGSVLEQTILQHLFDSGDVRTYYSCGGTYRYLMRWTDHTVKHESIEIFARGLLPKACHMMEYGLMPITRQLRRWLRLRMARPPTRGDVIGGGTR